MKTLLTLTMLMATLAITHARIGETLEQATTRYGQPIEYDDAGWISFKKGDFDINVQIHDSKIDVIEYVKINSTLGKSVELSEVETNNFLKANYTGTWNKIQSKSKQWNAPKSKFWAIQNFFVNDEEPSEGYYRLLILTEKAGDRFIDELKAKETSAQAGF